MNEPRLREAEPPEDVRAKRGAGKAVRCPHCRSAETLRVALFGRQLMTSQYQCSVCGQIFEAVRWTGSGPLGQSGRPRVSR